MHKLSYISRKRIVLEKNQKIKVQYGQAKKNLNQKRKDHNLHHRE